ncbi:MAG: hypothetical protein KBT69_12195 [Oceanihabitans sp.]|nr:hypothetical protein [Oceanihabitans sp.]
MKTNKKHKEVVLVEEIIEILQYKAEKASRNLKSYMEFVLYRKAYAFELSEEYKL